MERFIRLTVIGKMGNVTERLFNLRYVKTIEPSTSSVLLFGNNHPFHVSEESMRALLGCLEENRRETPFAVYTKAYYDWIDGRECKGQGVPRWKQAINNFFAWLHDRK